MIKDSKKFNNYLKGRAETIKRLLKVTPNNPNKTKP